MFTLKKVAALVAVGLCFGWVIWFGFFARARGASQEKPARTVLSKLPPIKNCVEHIKLIKAELLDRAGSQVASLELENEAYVGVISISVEQIVGRAKHSAVESAFSPDKAPLIIIAPGQTRTITLENLGAKSPIRIGGAMFADGTEEGCEPSLKDMRELRNFHEKKGSRQK